jgi:hypothetical protein
MTLPLWVLPVIPLAGFAINGLLGTRLGKSFVTAVGCGARSLRGTTPRLSSPSGAGWRSGACRSTSRSGWIRFRR